MVWCSGRKAPKIYNLVGKRVRGRWKHGNRIIILVSGNGDAPYWTEILGVPVFRVQRIQIGYNHLLQTVAQGMAIILVGDDLQTLIRIGGGFLGARSRGDADPEVSNGSGDGEYPTGTIVTVSADPPPAGQQFAGWTGDTAILANPFLATTSATIPSIDVSITATYKAVSAGAATTEALSTEAAGDKIRYYPRSGWTGRMVGGVFEGTSGDPVSGPYHTIHTVKTSRRWPGMKST